MKEATGELSMTVIVIIGAIAIVGILSFLGPRITNYVENEWGKIEGTSVNCQSGTYNPATGNCDKK